MQVNDADLSGGFTLHDRVRQSAKRAAFDTLPLGMLAGVGITLGVTFILWPRVPQGPLLAWCLLRLLIMVARVAHARHVLRTGGFIAWPHRRLHELLALCDGVAWGYMGWGLTPLFNLEVSVVTISVLCTVACIGGLIMSVDLPPALLFVWPMCLPNAVYAAGRQDDLGWFCAAAVGGLAAMLSLAARDNNRRVTELMRLRIESDMANEAKAEALDQARLLSEARSRFVATMSHEMRTPLHGMLGMVNLLRHEVPDAHVQRRLTVVQRSGQHLMQVINDVLDFSRSEAGSLPIHSQPFALQPVLQEAADMVRASAFEKGLSLDVQIRIAPDEWVEGDAMRLRQVLLNLLGNAIKFTAHGGVRLLAARDHDTGHLRVAISDTGEGIATQELPRIFEPFHQAQGTYERRHGGTGLGLTISRDLCRAMGGDITCTSVVGQGSVFVASWPLPRVRRPEHERVPTQWPLSWSREALKGLRVLLVEDNPVNALVAQVMLEQLGTVVAVADDGEAALLWLQAQSADVILMDCEMPGIDGFETTRRVRALEQVQGRPRCPVVALTANGPETFEACGLPAGMDAYLGKPFDLEALAATLSAHGLERVHRGVVVRQ
jgi:signal transduction histidine kinase/ActR/RegA family two-component response regulator